MDINSIVSGNYDVVGSVTFQSDISDTAFRKIRQNRNSVRYSECSGKCRKYTCIICFCKNLRDNVMEWCFDNLDYMHIYLLGFMRGCFDTMDKVCKKINVEKNYIFEKK